MQKLPKQNESFSKKSQKSIELQKKMTYPLAINKIIAIFAT
jgi:hypothetical protein